MIYSGGTRKVNKDVSTVAGFGVPNSVAATVAHAHHRSRRGYMNPYFSKRSIINMEPMIHERITALCGRLEGALNEACVISLDKAFSAMTADIITNRFFGYHYDYLSIPELKFPVRDAFLGVSTIFHVTRFVPWLIKYLKMLPNPVIRLILAPVADLLDLQKEIKKNIRKMQNEKAVDGADKSVIIEALGDEKIPAKERSITRLVDEGQVIIFAGTETSSRALAVGMYYLLSEKSLIEKMRAELATLSDVPDASWTVHQLEHMPFLVSAMTSNASSQANLDTYWRRQREYSSCLWSRDPSAKSGYRGRLALQRLRHCTRRKHILRRKFEKIAITNATAVPREPVYLFRTYESHTVP